MKKTNILTSIMVMAVIVLLVITAGLGTVTALREHKKDDPITNENTDNRGQSMTTPGAEIPNGGQAGNTPAGQDVPDTPTPTPFPTFTPTPTPIPSPKIVVGIDPGKQSKNDTSSEAVGPGSEGVKSRMAYGATSVTTGMREHEWNLIIAKLVRTELESLGYEVYMTRDTADVFISNSERAKAANEAGAVVLVSIQADAFNDDSVQGIYCQEPSDENAFVKDTAKASRSLAKCIKDRVLTATGARDRADRWGDDEALINWFEGPSCILRLGYMSCPEEDARMMSADYQKSMAAAIAQGIDSFIKENGVR